MLTPQFATDLPEIDFKPFAPEAVLEGAPTYRAWQQETALDGRYRSGVWEMTPGTYRLARNGTAEFCHILQGRAVITPDVGEPFEISAGSAFTLHPDFTGTWSTRETVRKFWVIVA